MSRITNIDPPTRAERRANGWDGAPDASDRFWTGVLVAVLTLAGAVLIVAGQAPIYRLALWVGGWL